MSGGKENGCAESVVGKITPFTKLKSALAFYIMSEGALMRVLRHDAAGDGVHTVAICAALAMVAERRWWLAGDGGRQEQQLRGHRSDDQEWYNL